MPKIGSGHGGSGRGDALHKVTRCQLMAAFNSMLENEPSMRTLELQKRVLTLLGRYSRCSIKLHAGQIQVYSCMVSISVQPLEKRPPRWRHPQRLMAATLNDEMQARPQSWCRVRAKLLVQLLYSSQICCNLRKGDVGGVVVQQMV